MAGGASLLTGLEAVRLATPSHAEGRRWALRVAGSRYVTVVKRTSQSPSYRAQTDPHCYYPLHVTAVFIIIIDVDGLQLL